mgnify:CR=1 FL=1
MSSLPRCPACNSEYTYEDGDNFVCPECAHEWPKQAAAETAEAQKVWKDANGNVLQDGDSVRQIKVGPRSQEVLEMVVDMKDSVEQAFTSIRDAGDAIRLTSEEIASVSRRVNNALGEDDSEFRQFFADLRRATSRAETAIANFDKILVNVNDIVGDSDGGTWFATPAQAMWALGGHSLVGVLLAWFGLRNRR